MTPASLEWPTQDLLAHRAAATPQRRALIDIETETAWTFAEFTRRVDRTAAALETTVGRGDGGHIGVLTDTRPAFATLFFAAMRRGATVAPLNVRETASELAAKADRLDLDALVCERETASTASELVDERTPILSVDDPTTDGVTALSAGHISPDSDESTAGEPEVEVEPAPLDREDVQLLMFTSGTSGEPKIVQLTVGNLVASATASAFRLGVDPADRWLCCLPMYHMGGIAPVIRSTLYGTTAVVQRTFDDRATARAMDEFGITGVSLVPTMCKRLLDAGWEPPESLRFVLLGGAPASTEFIERCREASVPVYPTYGMTETASQITTATPTEATAHEGTVGQPLVVTDVSVVGETGDPVPTGEPGELVVSGPTVTPGYLDAARTADAFCDRGLRTGDVGYRDDEGRLWILNRRSDRIITGGENVDPGEVIDVLLAHPRIEAAAVVGLEDEEWGERVGALVVPAEGTASLAVESVRNHCDDRLAGFKRPKTIGVVDELPRTHSGTVDRDATRDRLLEVGVDVTEPSR
ncbi:class I adenylate-forming enzyme family protein [Natrialba asiatica]|uniref:O-succinylbenzoate--CoA ligase n=1 Tax=Natrialba asiatica (strain ATCC 700177 / DSM 12278 / JCM 9576 / FERM P-10747 / NBRC 102637 / 172P1) TaxID=29540 RepID=M0ASL5_NATA1|nr:class I adenylate-forming enzyme family protein [Natrialba asiatica]ELZ00943.1 o-succinylbenzoate--CoA ligase [Natrialba asiatica DSM 12278]